MPGSPFYGGLLEGFNQSRDAEYQQQLKQEADARAGESKIYDYLLQSRDPEIQQLALSGLFESARPGTRAKGLRGWMGEVQKGEVYPRLKAAMDEQVPDEAPAAPGAGALPSTTPVHGGPTQAVSPSGQMPGRPLAPEAPPAGAEMVGAPPPGMPAQNAGAPVQPPPGSAMGMAGAPPPEHPTHRRGTGVPTAEEIAGAKAQAELQGKISAVSPAILAAGGTQEDVRRAVLGMVGAPIPLDNTAAGPVLADPNDPTTPIPTIRHRDGSVTLIDGSPVAPGMVGWIKPPASTGGLTSYVKDSPEIRAKYGLTQPSPTGEWHIKQMPDGSTQIMAADAPPAYTGTTTIASPESPTGRVVTPILRGGGTGAPLGNAPAPEGQKSPDVAEAEGWVRAVDKQISEGRIPGLALRAGTYDQKTKAISKGKYQTYADLQKAAGQSSAVTSQEPSVADRVQQILDANHGGAAPRAPRPPTRVGGPPPPGP